MLNLDSMNDLKFAKQTTEKDFQNDSMLYNVFSSLREKINAPIKNKK
jgi:hypothetical protein